MTALTLKRLREIGSGSLTPRNARDACLELGGLARWWLRPEVLRLAHLRGDPAMAELTNPEQPTLSAALGCCWIICRADGNLPLLRSAMLLPLRWQEKTTHAKELLPEKLVRLADRALEQVRGMNLFKQLFCNPWGIQPAPEMSLETPLSDDIFETLDSGWVSLLGGLLAAGQGLLPKRDVWASVACAEQTRFARVHGLAEKLRLAVDWEQETPTFFVHWSQVGEAENWVETNARERIRIKALGSPDESRVWETLKTFIAEWTAEPEVPDPNSPNEPQQFDKCRDFFLNLRPFSSRANQFYRSHLLDGIIRRYRLELRKHHPNLKVTRFVTIVSESSELAIMTASALDAERCLLLHTGGKMEEKAKECADWLGEKRCAIARIGAKSVVEDIAKLVDEFTRHIPPGEVVLDLKPGTKKMTYALLRVAQPLSRIVNLEPHFLDDRRNIPGTEIPELLEAISCHRPAPEA